MDNLVLYANLQLILILILGLSYIVYCVKYLEGCALKIRIDKSIFKSMLSYSSWSFMGTAAYTSYNYGYNILLNLFFDPAVNAARGIAVQVQHAVESFSNNFQASMNPQIIKNYSAGNMERVHSLVVASSKYSFFLMLLLSLPLIIETEYVLNIWLTIVPPHTVTFVRLILSIITISCMSGPMIASCQATGHIKRFETVVGIIMTSSVPVCYIVLLYGGIPESIYWIYLLFSYAALFVRCMIALPLIRLGWKRYLYDVVFRVVCVTITSVPIPLYLYTIIDRQALGSFISIFICSVCTVSLSVYFLGMTKMEKVYVYNRMIRLRLSNK